MNYTPRELGELRMELANEYATISDQLGIVLSRKPALWLSLRQKANSDKAADRAYDATQDGIDEIALRSKLKSIEKKLSAAKTMLDVLMGEARNQM